MNRTERIKSILTEALRPTFLEIKDDSGKHAGHSGAQPEGETHYSLIIESARFAGMGKVQCHQLVYSILKDEFQKGLHALSITTRISGVH